MSEEPLCSADPDVVAQNLFGKVPPVKRGSYAVSGDTVELYQQLVKDLSRSPQVNLNRTLVQYLSKGNGHDGYAQKATCLAYLYSKLSRRETVQEPYASLRQRLYESPLLAAMLYHVGTQRKEFAEIVNQAWDGSIQ